MRFVLALLASLWLSPASAQWGGGSAAGIIPNAQGQVPSMATGVAPSTIYVPYATQSISTTADTSCFSSTGKGPGQTITPVTGIPYVGNTFVMICEGVFTTPAISATPSSSTVMCWGTFSYAQAATGSSLVIANFQTTSPVSVDTTAAFKIDMTLALASSLGTENLTAVGGNIQIIY